MPCPFSYNLRSAMGAVVFESSPSHMNIVCSLLYIQVTVCNIPLKRGGQPRECSSGKVQSSRKAKRGVPPRVQFSLLVKPKVFGDALPANMDIIWLYVFVFLFFFVFHSVVVFLCFVVLLYFCFMLALQYFIVFLSFPKQKDAECIRNLAEA